jgi:VIT1/CCC1 family predicted Fe2+/Mn2+ transporter
MAVEHLHTPEAIARRLRAGPRQSYLRDWVYGGIDGAVTTFAVVAGVEGASLAPSIILVLGVANLVGDGFAMAAGNYSATHSEKQEFDHFEALEIQHIEEDPEGEVEEVRQIYMAKGFEGAQLEAVVEGITRDREQWIATMMVEEHGLPLSIRSAFKAAATTFMAFILCGTVPLIPYAFGWGDGFHESAVLTGAVFVGIGSLRSRWSVQAWWRLGLGTLLIGSVAAAAAFGVGHLLAGVGG